MAVAPQKLHCPKQNLCNIFFTSFVNNVPPECHKCGYTNKQNSVGSARRIDMYGARKMTDLTMTDQNAEMDIDRPDIDGPSNRYGH